MAALDTTWMDSGKRPFRYLYVAFAIFQCFLGAGIIFGWTSLVPVLEKERIYNEYCAEGESLCTAQSDRLQYAFTMAGSSSMMSNLLLGLVFDKFGPRVTKAISLVLLMTGALLMGNAHYRPNAEGTDLLLYGMVLVGFSGPGIQLAGIHISNLFPEATALVACFIVGGLQLSFLIFTIFDLAYMHLGMSMSVIFEVYACVVFLSLIVTLFTEPDKPFEVSEARRNSIPEEQHELLSPMRLPSVFKEEETSLLMSTPELEKNRRRRRLPTEEVFFDGDLQSRSFKTQVLSRPFLLIVFYFSILSLWCNFFLGSITALLRWKGLAPGEVTGLLAQLAFVLPGSVVFIPVVGYLLETCGYTYSAVMCTVMAMACTTLLSSSSTVSIVGGFVTYAFFRTILFPLLFAYIGHRFGFQHFGALSGIAFCIGGLVGLLQTPIAAIEDFKTIGYLQFGSMMLTLIAPYCEYQRGR